MTYTLGHNFIIHNALFISEVKCNLLSFGQWLDESDHLITLPNGLFVVEDPISMMPTAVVEGRNEIFIYWPLNLSSMFTSSV